MMTTVEFSHEEFYKYFNITIQSLEERIKTLPTAAAASRKDVVYEIRGAISTLTKELADNSPQIPGYDQKLYNETLKILTASLNTAAAAATPKPRFQFRKTVQKENVPDTRKLTATHASASQNRPSFITSAESPSTPPTQKDYNIEIAKSNALIRRPSFSQATDIIISGQKDIRIVLPESAEKATASGRLTKLEGCVVDLSGATKNGKVFRGMAIRGVKEAVLVTGTVDGPVHATGIVGSVVVIVARQVRIHECRDVDIYLHCGSRPIIEDCSGLRFAPVPGVYAPGEVLGVNQWDQVDDFKWLKADKSPNWDVLEEGKRVGDKMWEGMETDVSSSPNTILKQLKAA